MKIKIKSFTKRAKYHIKAGDHLVTRYELGSNNIDVWCVKTEEPLVFNDITIVKKLVNIFNSDWYRVFDTTEDHYSYIEIS